MSYNEVEYYGRTLLGLAEDTVAPERMLEGTTAHDASGREVVGTIPTAPGQTIMPGRTDQTVAAGQYLGGEITVVGDVNLQSQNIALGVTLFGIPGTHAGGGGTDTSDATVMDDMILQGYTAYARGLKLTGTMEDVNDVAF